MTTPEQVEIIDAVAKRLTAQIVGNSGDHNGGRLSEVQAKVLAHLAVCTLLTQGWAIVKLPNSRQSKIYGQIEWPVSSHDGDAAVVIRHNGKIGNDGISNPYHSPRDARSHAAALLAAADEVFSRSFDDEARS